jgi:hypothetical protein
VSGVSLSTRVSLIHADWLPQDGTFESKGGRLSRVECDHIVWQWDCSIARSRISPSRPPTLSVWSSSGRLWVGLVVEYGQRPAPAGQFAGDRGVGHHGAFLAGIEAFPAAVQAPVGGLAASAGGRAGGCPASP